MINYHSDHPLINYSSDFQCLEAEGAVLVLPNGATIYDAANKYHFQTHAARHAVSWYEHALNEGRDISNGSLYFVTECTKSVNWGIAVFYGHPMADDKLRFIFDGGSYWWKPRNKVEARVGPKSKDILLSDDDEPNQCVFLRGYKIMLRRDIWDKLKSAVAVTSQGGEFLPSSTRTTSHSESEGNSSSQTDPSHQVSNDNNNTTNSSRDMGWHVHAQKLSGWPTKVVDASEPEASSDLLGQVILDENFREEAPVRIVLLQL